MSTLSIQVMTFYTKYNTFKAVHVNTVDAFEKPWFWAFQNFKQIKNQSNIKEAMRQAVDTKHIHTFLFDIMSNPNSFHCICQHWWQTTQHTQYTIALLWSFVLTISTCPLIYTQQIRWQWVASSLSNLK